MSKVALITGVTGQDGAYLSELLLSKGYQVHGLKRRTSSFNTERIDHLYEDPHAEGGRRYRLHFGDLTDSTNVIRIVQHVQPDEIYHLAAMSHVSVSFETPEYTANADAIGTLRLLEAIRILGLDRKTRFLNASTSELFGNPATPTQNEQSPLSPRSPYAVAKLYAHWITVNYREAYGLFACNGISFNHESPLRGETFVTRKITRGMARISLGLQDCLHLGNLDARRDWSHARDHVRGHWQMLQLAQPEDLVLASGTSHSVRDFAVLAARALGITLDFSGSCAAEVGTVTAVDLVDSELRARCQVGDVIVRVDPRYFRPTEVQALCGDASRAAARLGWSAEVGFEQLVREMADADYASARRDSLVKMVGFKTFNHNE